MLVFYVFSIIFFNIGEKNMFSAAADLHKKNSSTCNINISMSLRPCD